MGSQCQERKILRRKPYFNEEEGDNEAQTLQNLKTKVKLEFTIKDIEMNHRYQITVFFVNKQNDIFETEVLNSTQNIITFNTCYICDYFFGRNQKMTISLTKDSQLEGAINLALGNIVGSPNSCYKNAINSRANIIITAQAISNTNSYVEFYLSFASKIDFTKKKNLISYLVTSNSRKIYSSESISSYYDCFDKVRIPCALIQNGFTISFLDSLQEPIQFKNETIEKFTQPNKKVYLRLVVNGKPVYIYNKSR